MNPPPRLRIYHPPMPSSANKCIASHRFNRPRVNHKCHGGLPYGTYVQRYYCTVLLASVKRTLVTLIDRIFHADFAIERVTQFGQIGLDLVNVKVLGQWGDRNGRAAHFKQHAAAVGRNLLVRFQLVNGQAGLGEGARDRVHNARIVGTRQGEFPRICFTLLLLLFVIVVFLRTWMHTDIHQYSTDRSFFVC